MKKEKAPDKIFLQENTTTDLCGRYWPEWFEGRLKDTDVDYVHLSWFDIDVIYSIMIGLDKTKFPPGSVAFYEEVLRRYKISQDLIPSEDDLSSEV